MNEERMLENIGQVKEEFIEEAAPKGMLEEQQTSSKKAGKYTWIKWGALAACLCILVGLGVKMALPMSEPMDNTATNDIDTEITKYTTAQTIANTEALPVVNPPEDVDHTVGTAFAVDEGFPNWGITLSVKDVTATGLTLLVTQSGGEPTGTLETGDPYRLIALVDGTWKTVEELPLPEGVDARAWHSIAYLIPMEDTREFEINWEWMFGELSAGTYRLIKEFMDFRETADYDTFDYWVEFEIQ